MCLCIHACNCTFRFPAITWLGFLNHFHLPKSPRHPPSLRRDERSAAKRHKYSRLIQEDAQSCAPVRMCVYVKRVVPCLRVAQRPGRAARDYGSSVSRNPDPIRPCSAQTETWESDCRQIRCLIFRQRWQGSAGEGLTEEWTKTEEETASFI